MEIRKEDFLTEAEEYISSIYDQRLESNNPLYIQIKDAIQKQCEEYGISYREDIDEILSHFQTEVVPIKNPMEIMNQLQEDVKQVSNVKDAQELKLKYNQIQNAYRVAISKFIQNTGVLFHLLKGEIQESNRILNSIPSLEERKEPKLVVETTEDGWWVFDEAGNEKTRLETPAEVKNRIQKEDAYYENVRIRISELKKELARWMEFLIILPQLSSIYETLKNISNMLYDLEKEQELKKYNKNPEFIEEVMKIMQHDKEEFEYLYHGTQCVEDADSILESGLFMERQDLSTTTYSEFTLEQVLTYSRGFDGSIGKDAIVVIKRPKGKDIVEENHSETRVFAQSGLSGHFGTMPYKIPKEYIIGYINKRDEKVVHSPVVLEDDKTK